MDEDGRRGDDNSDNVGSFLLLLSAVGEEQGLWKKLRLRQLTDFAGGKGDWS